MGNFRVDIFKLRSNTQIAETALKYLARNIRGLYGSITIYSLSLILTAVVICLNLGLPFNATENIYPYRNLSGQHILVPLMGAFILRLVGITFHNQIISRHLIQSNPAQELEGITPKTLLTYLKEDFMTLFFNYLILTGFLYLFNTGYEYVMGNAYDSSGAYADSVGSLLSAFISTKAGWLPYIFVFPLLHYFYVAILFVTLKDGAGLAVAFNKVWHYSGDKLKNVWIASTIYLVLTYLVYYITNTMLSILFFWLPGFLSGWSGTSTSSWLDSYGLVILVLKYLVVALYQVMVILHYGNLVEIKDETGIKQQIDSI